MSLSRLVAVGHSYVTDMAQRKYAAMRRLRPDLQIRVIVPPRSGHIFRTFEAEIGQGLTAEEVVVLPQYLSWHHMSYIHSLGSYSRLLSSFRPQLVHIENDPHSLVGLQTVAMTRRCVPEARISFFIWDNLNRQPPGPLNAVKRAMMRYCFDRADLVVCGNRKGQALLADKEFHGRSAVLPQVGLDEDMFDRPAVIDRRAELGVTHGTCLIGYLGRLVPEKGILDLLHALEGIPDLGWRLLLLGNGALDAELREVWAPRLGDRLILRPPVRHDEMADYLKALDVYVLPSRSTPTWIEQFGLTLAQAMMCGVASIGSSSGAIPDVLAGAGMVFPEGNVEQLRDALVRMITDRAERAALAAAGRRVARDRYATGMVASQYLDLFDQVVGTEAE